MFDWLFPNWSSPETVVVVVSLRLLLDVALVGLVARVSGPRSWLTVGAATLTLLSAVLVVSVLRPGGAGRLGSYLELSIQAVLVLVGGLATYRDPSRRRLIAFGALALGVVGMLLPAIVLYGEATVAP